MPSFVLPTKPAIEDTMTIALPWDQPSSRPHFSRESISENRYREAPRSDPWSPRERGFVVRANYRFADVELFVDAPIERREPQPPYGAATRELMVVPALAVNVSPRQAIVPLAANGRLLRMQIDLLNNSSNGSRGELTLKLPARWTSTPASVPFAFARAGEKSRFGPRSGPAASALLRC